MGTKGKEIWRNVSSNAAEEGKKSNVPESASGWPPVGGALDLPGGGGEKK